MPHTLPTRPPRLRRAGRRATVSLLAAASLCAAGVAGLAQVRRGSPPPASSAAAADTVPVFGPRRFAAGQGTPALHVERFSAGTAPATRFLVRATGADAERAEVKLNGVALFGAAELRAAGGALLVAVPLRAENTLEVGVEGAAGTGVTLSVLRVPDPTFNVFGPRRVVRATGSPVPVVERFALPAGSGAPFTLHVENGAADGSRRVSSAVVRVGGAEVLSPSDLNQNVAGVQRGLSLGADNGVEVEVRGAPEGYLTLWITATDGTPPVLAIATPQAGAATRKAQVQVTGTVADQTPTRVTVNGQEATRSGDAFEARVGLAEGENSLAVSAVDAAGNRTDSVRVVVLDTQPPVLALSAPADGAVTRDSVAVVRGTVADRGPVKVMVDDTPAEVDASGAFEARVALAEGTGFITVSATDRAGNTATEARRVVRDTQPPVITVAEPAEGATTDAEAVAVRGTVADATPVTLALNGAPLAVGSGGAFEASHPLEPGSNSLALSAVDAAGNRAELTRVVTRQGEPDPTLPPDPARVAPPIDRTVATPLAEATAFLYTGAAPIQTGVAPGTIAATRVAVLRGRVLTVEGAPLPGATVSVLGHPEYGETRSRADGRYDLAVNGGDRVVVNLAHDGYLPAQRHTTVEWQEFGLLDDAVLVRLDPRVTRVDLAADTVQVARGSEVRDADGPRQATLLFEPGTAAEMVLPDGSVAPLGSLGVRATEYTVGENGPRAMPGPLPPTTAYTYAVELSVDEARAAGATSVKFSRPVSLYVENFLNFPVGMPVPVATYDCLECGTWRPEENGRVIRVFAAMGGVAPVDANGDGAPDDAAALAALGLDAAELARLATLYPAGANLWRTQLRHFSPIDLNYPNGPPDDAENPDPDPERDQDDDDDCPQGGSVISCTNRALGERVGISGTAFTLAYQSNRAPGRRAGRVTIPLTGASVPASLRRVVLEIDVAGRRIRHEFAAAPGLSHTFDWDGRDAYGRALQGEHPVEIRVGYVYPYTYRVPAYTARSFGLTCTGPVGEPWSGSIGWQACTIPTTVTSAARQEETMWATRRLMVGAGPDFDARAAGLGGWTLDVHHWYDPAARVLHMGNGDRRSAGAMGPAIRTLAGNGFYGSTGDGGPAAQASFRQPDRIAVAPDGTLFIPDAASNVVRRIAPDGTITRAAGSGAYGFGGDGGPATRAAFRTIYDVALGPDGALYIADFDNHRIRRVGKDGIVATIAGNGGWGNSGDGGRATQAQLGFPWGLTVGPDCSIYVASDWNVIRKISPDGIITTVAGNGSYGYSGDGGLATQASLAYPDGVTIGPDGSLYIEDVDNGAIRKVSPEGMISTVAGGGGLGNDGGGTGPAALSAAQPRARVAPHQPGERNLKAAAARAAGQGEPAELHDETVQAAALSPGDGGAATGVYLSLPFAVAVARDGTLYIAEAGANRVRQVAPDGTIATVAGTGAYNFTGDGGPAGAATLRGPWGVSLGPDGSLYISDTSNRRVRRVNPPMPGFQGTDLAVASEDGTRLFQFNAGGRHLRTMDARTGRVVYAFGYNAAGHLVKVTDGDGLATTVERDAAGRPAGVVGPYGARTGLSVDGAGYLAGFTAPDGAAVKLEYAPGGLLTSMTDARGGVYRFAYNEDGTLLSDADPLGGTKTLARPARPGAMGAMALAGAPTLTTFTSAMGRTTTIQVEALADGGQRRTTVAPTGLTTVQTTRPDGTEVVEGADGTVTRVVRGADPRFSMQAPVMQRMDVILPSGLGTSFRSVRRAVLADEADPLTLVSQTDSLVVTGGAFTSTFQAASGQVVRTTPEGRRLEARVDGQGRPLTVKTAGVAALHYAYDAGGRLTSVTQGGRSWRYVYDAAGRVAEVVDPLQRRSRYAYDDAGRMTREILPDGREVRYGYDAGGSLARVVTPGGGEHAFGYSATGLITSAAAAGEAAGAYEYDADRMVGRVARPGGVALEFGYDAAGRLASLAHPGGRSSFAFHPATGVLASASTGDGGAVAFTYDGTLPLSMRWSGAVSGEVGFSYDGAFRVASESINGAHGVAFRYDRDGMLAGAGQLGITRRADNGYLAGTRVGSVSTALEYDSLGQSRVLAATFGSATLFRAEYQRDLLGRITRLVEGDGSGEVVWEYGYDEAGRLVRVLRDGQPHAAYEYDEAGNRVRATGPAGVEAGSYDARDRLVSYGGSTYGYTAAGELAFRAAGADTTRYTYDALGGLRRVVLPGGTRVEYLTDATGRRIGKKVDGVLVRGFLYTAQTNPVAELDGAGAVVSRFVYGASGHVPDYMERAGRTFRLVTDHLGSVRAVVDAATGAVAQRIDYDAFGRVVRDTRPGFQPFGFAGGLHDEHSGLLRFGARDYDARTGRWTAPDPIGFDGGDTNLYRYSFGDPVNWNDPEGTIPACLVAAVAGGLIDGGMELLDQYRKAEACGGEIDWGDVGWEGLKGAGLGCGLGQLGKWWKIGKEFKFSKNFRVAPFGNRTNPPHPYGRYPHYHRRGPAAPNGETMPGQGVGRHRPFQPSPHDKSWWDRF